MPYEVVIAPGLTQVALPNGAIYDAGDTVVLTAEQFGTIPTEVVAQTFSSVTLIGGGSAVTSVNEMTGDVVLDAAAVGAAAADHTHTAAEVGAAATTHTHSADAITSGTLVAARIPSLPATQITSGTLATARIPSLPASQITSGTLAAAVLPKGAAVADVAGGADAAALATTLNSLLASLRAAGYLAP